MKLKTLKSGLQSMPQPKRAEINTESWRTDKRSSAERGYGHKWRVARAAYLSKHPLCVYCEREGRVRPASVVDHSIPHRGDMALFWDSSKWLSLCAHCHSSTAQRRDQALQ